MAYLDGWASPRQAFAVMSELKNLETVDKHKLWPAGGDLDGGPWDEVGVAEELPYKFSELAGYLDREGSLVAKKDEKVQWAGFKDVRLTDAQRDAYEKWDCHDSDLYELVAVTVSTGYKFTCSYNQSNDTYTASYTGGTNAPAGSKGYTLSAFAPTWYDAVRTLCFKHDLVLEGDWTKIVASAAARWG